MWCKKCNRDTKRDKCEVCGTITEADIPIEMYWCAECKVPIIKYANDIDKMNAPVVWELLLICVPICDLFSLKNASCLKFYRRSLSLI